MQLTESFSQVVKKHLERYFNAHDVGGLPEGLYEILLKEFDRSVFEVTLLHTKGNQTKAAHILGINRNTLRKRLTSLDEET